jgi:hypothetical protein
MSQTRRAVFQALVLGLSGVGAWAARKSPRLEAEEVYGLLGQCTRLSVLSGRILRSQAQRALNVLPQQAQTILSASTAEVRQLLRELDNALLDTALHATNQSMIQAYTTLLRASETLNPKDHAALLRLGYDTIATVNAVDKLDEHLLQQVGNQTARIMVTTAEMQRLTQHLAARFMMLRTGLGDKEQRTVLLADREAFARGLAQLQAAPLKTTKIQEQLALLANQWLLMDAALGKESAEASAMEHVCTTSERTLELLSALYRDYDVALKQLLG